MTDGCYVHLIELSSTQVIYVNRGVTLTFHFVFVMYHNAVWAKVLKNYWRSSTTVLLRHIPTYTFDFHQRMDCHHTREDHFPTAQRQTRSNLHAFARNPHGIYPQRQVSCVPCRIWGIFQARPNWSILYLYAVSIHFVNKGDWRGPGDMGTMPEVTQGWSWALQWKKKMKKIV